MTPLFCQLVDSSERTLLRRQYGNRELEITWEQNSGRLQGFLYRDGKAISVTLSGLPKRRVPIEELPLVRNYVFIQVLENAIFLKFKIIHNKRLATVLKQSIGGALI